MKRALFLKHVNETINCIHIFMKAHYIYTYYLNQDTKATIVMKTAQMTSRYTASHRDGAAKAGTKPHA